MKSRTFSPAKMASILWGRCLMILKRQTFFRTKTFADAVPSSDPLMIAP